MQLPPKKKCGVLLDLSAFSITHVMQAGIDGAVEEREVVKDKPAADGALASVLPKLLVKPCMFRYTHLFSSRCLSCCLMLVYAGLVWPACLYFYRSATY